jgi:hypothetical protein
MAATKKKRLTQREKRLRAEAKKELQAEGKIPPDKPRLNRKKFAEEVLAEFHEMGGIEDVLYIYKAIACMVGPKMPKITAEQVGVLKMLKIAVETKKFHETLRAEHRAQYTVEEYVDKVVLPIFEL